MAPMDWQPWPTPTDDAGRPRTVGVEIEVGELGVAEVSAALKAELGGEVEEVGPHEHHLEGGALGRLKIEMDSRFVKERGHRAVLEKVGIEPEGDALVEVLDGFVASAATHFVPCEIVTSPLGYDEMTQLERVMDVLRGLDAKGTAAAPWYAFGIHFNPSLPSERPESLHAYIQAFLLLEDWIREDIDFSRKITPYVDPFPESYRNLVLGRTEGPGKIEGLIDEYLEHNPTRNRGLDMLPAFAHLDEPRVRAAVEDVRVKARPTFHYRLGDCRVDEPGWRLANEWAPWVEVERLAVDQERREDLVRRGVRAEGPLPG